MVQHQLVINRQAKFDVLEGGKRIGTVHTAQVAAQIVREIARRDARAAAEWAVGGVS